MAHLLESTMKNRNTPKTTKPAMVKYKWGYYNHPDEFYATKQMRSASREGRIQNKLALDHNG